MNSFKTLCFILLFIGCNRPSSEYDVSVAGDGQNLADLSAPSSPMGGLVEYSRLQLLGDNIGLGFTGLTGDQPAASGAEWIMGTAQFGYPANPSFDQISNFFTPVRSASGKDRCITKPGARSFAGAVENVDIGDTIRFESNRFQASLQRDPAYYPRPAGEEWYVGYASGLLPKLRDHAVALDNWRSGAVLTLKYPGTLPPETATIGAIPFPGEATFTLATAIADLKIDGEAPGSATRITGPWSSATQLSWTPASDPKPLTLSLRLLGEGVENDCSCDADCGSGFTCVEDVCVGNDGATWNQLGEVVCWIEDDGQFELTPEHIAPLMTWLGEGQASGALLGIGRIEESAFNVPPVLTHNGKRFDIQPVRIRSTDVVFTRVELKQ